MKQTFYALIILFLGCTSKRSDTHNTKVEKDQIADTTIASKPEPNDTVYTISDRNIVSDKNYKMTYEFKFTNQSKRVVENKIVMETNANKTTLFLQLMRKRCFFVGSKLVGSSRFAGPSS